MCGALCDLLAAPPPPCVHFDLVQLCKCRSAGILQLARNEVSEICGVWQDFHNPTTT